MEAVLLDQILAKEGFDMDEFKKKARADIHDEAQELESVLEAFLEALEARRAQINNANVPSNNAGEDNDENPDENSDVNSDDASDSGSDSEDEYVASDDPLDVEVYPPKSTIPYSDAVWDPLDLSTEIRVPNNVLLPEDDVKLLGDLLYNRMHFGCALWNKISPMMQHDFDDPKWNIVYHWVRLAIRAVVEDNTRALVRHTELVNPQIVHPILPGVEEEMMFREFFKVCQMPNAAEMDFFADVLEVDVAAVQAWFMVQRQKMMPLYRVLHFLESSDFEEYCLARGF